MWSRVHLNQLGKLHVLATLYGHLEEKGRRRRWGRGLRHQERGSCCKSAADQRDDLQLKVWPLTLSSRKAGETDTVTLHEWRLSQDRHMLLWSSHWKLQTEGSAGDPMPSTNINDPNKSGWAYGESDELKKPPQKTVPPLSFPDSLLFLLRCLPSSFTTCKTLKSLDPKIWTLIKLFNVENSLISILSDVSLCADQMVYQVQEISQFLSGKRKKESRTRPVSIQHSFYADASRASLTSLGQNRRESKLIYSFMLASETILVCFVEIETENENIQLYAWIWAFAVQSIAC